MFLRRTERKKNGKTHHYWNVVENKRLDGGRVVQRHVLYLGEINSSQAAAWRNAIEKYSMKILAARGRWRCFLRIDAGPLRAMRPSFSSLYLRCSFVARGSGAPAGWPATYITNWGWMSFGPSACPPPARVHVGIGCYKPSARIG